MARGETWVTLEHLHRYAVAAELARGRDVLDIASGEGYGAALLARGAKSVVGVDLSDEAVAHAVAKYAGPHLRFLRGAADRIPIPDAAVDLAVSFETIEHHDRHDDMMRELKRVLRPGGLLLLSTPDKLHYSDLPKHRNPYHVKELYREELEALARRHFANVRILGQRCLFGSLIAPGNGGFVEYRGTFEEVRSTRGVSEPIVNLCLAGDGPLPELGASLFEGMRLLDDVKELNRLRQDLRRTSYELDEIRRSRLYRLMVRIRRLFGR